MSVPSLAEMAVTTLASVARMLDNVTNDHPERHAVRALKRLAEQGLENALRQAQELAYLAKTMQNEREIAERKVAS